MNEHLRLAIDHLREGVQVISYDWRYLYVNETAALHGRRSAAELGTRCAVRQTWTSRPPRRRQKSPHTQTMSL